ncbi:HNH endonuclease [Radiobacillus deserti]|uniref:HNH nuclease domain-containing protein n=1 Tax=Radiobacillus deserti TaxID=2594883 RepID=A0A516KDF4_9BACI|nr:HNH endonuclease [Radiobacillus deserti]QDP39435.1 hypothetical protein FN924_04140 [Radiobacillus deserti]
MEQWKVIKKPSVTFEVSNEGRIKVFNRKEGKFNLIHAFSYTGGHEGNRYLATHGYYVHRLVAEAFIGPIDGLEVNHKNGRKKYNYVSNLEIVTPKYNHQHSWKTGLRDKQKLSKKEIDRREIRTEMRRLNKQWIVYDLNFNIISRHNSQEDAAKSIGVSRQTANNSFRLGRPITKQYYICKPVQVEEFKKQVSGGN